MIKPATIKELLTTTTRYALQVDGDAMAPDVRDGQCVAVDPAAVAQPGDLVVAAIQGRQGVKLGVMRLNGDGDLVDRKGGFVPRGRWRVLGVVFSVSP